MISILSLFECITRSSSLLSLEEIKLVVIVNWIFYVPDLSRLLMISFKVGLSPLKKNYVICLIESPLKIMKNAFYFILKALFILKIFKFLSRLFGHTGKTV